jgi:hypothetical protein
MSTGLSPSSTAAAILRELLNSTWRDYAAHAL